MLPATTRVLAALLVLGSLIAPISASDIQASGDEAGFVLEVAGSWSVGTRPGQALTPGSTLQAGARVERTKPNPGDKLVIALYTGAVQTLRDSGSVTAAVQPGLVDRVWLAVKSRYRSGFVHSISRGRDFRDAVLSVTASGEVDLEPVVGSGDDRPVAIRFTRLDAQGTPTSTILGPLAMGRPKTDGTVHLKVDGLEAGVWLASGYDGKGPNAQATGKVAWVLVVPEAKRQSVSTSLEEARVASQAWGTDVGPGVVRAYLRSYMLALSEGGAIR